jgi:Peptidase family M23
VEVRDVLVTHVLGPIVLLLLVARYRPISRLDAGMTVAAAVSPFTFLWLAGRWHLASVWMRQALPVAVLVVTMVSLRRSRALPLYASNGAATWMLRAVKTALALFISVQIAAALGGRRVQERMVALEFPLRYGRFYVGQGGATAAVNYHVVNRTQRFALDIVKLNSWGNRASRFHPNDLRQYASFGESIYAPCSGRVQQVESSMRDNPIAGEQDRTKPAGNHVVLRCDGTDVDVVLAHMQSGSVHLTTGEQIRAGRIIGAIGNSGNATEPHLHIHARRNGNSASGLDGEPVPMSFGGRFLVRNAVWNRTD